MAIQINRKGETGPIPFRTGRFFCIDAKWYFACREGMDRGPYDTRGDAVAAMESFLSAADELQERTQKIS